MALRPPPGRSGRTWLARRLETAGRAASLLDQKRRGLLAEERRLAGAEARAGERWERAATAAERWALRAALLGGRRQFDLVRAATARSAAVEVRWRSWMGVTYPAEARMRPGEPGPAALGGTAALDVAAAAALEAVEAAAAHAAVSRALDLVRAEIAAATARQRALELRWVPRLAAAIDRLEAALDEQEREDGVRSRWLRGAALEAGSGDTREV